jgi:Zn-dependent protease
MEVLYTLLNIAVIALPVMFAIILHEVSHGWVANKLGDHTARDLGRLTLNPIPHIDLFGTIIMPLLLYLLYRFHYTDSLMIFGYAKPVPINPYNFKDPKKDMALSSLAGPGVNILMAISFAFILRVVMLPMEGLFSSTTWEWIVKPLGYGIFINVLLAVLNMIPIPPLDGSRVVYWLLPNRYAAAYYRLERFGIIILLMLMMSGILWEIIEPVIAPILSALLGPMVL